MACITFKQEAVCYAAADSTVTDTVEPDKNVKNILLLQSCWTQDIAVTTICVI